MQEIPPDFKININLRYTDNFVLGPVSYSCGMNVELYRNIFNFHPTINWRHFSHYLSYAFSINACLPIQTKKLCLVYKYIVKVFDLLVLKALVRSFDK